MLLEIERKAPAAGPLRDHDSQMGAGRGTAAPAGGRPLKILHVFRAPVGGLFRHVLDLAHGQVARGHQVGFILDSTTGGARAEQALAEIAPQLALGLSRVAMPRFPGLHDLTAVQHVSRRIAAIAPDVVHGHGAKGTAYARMTSAAPSAIRVYTPHGGGLHYCGTAIGLLYLAIERALMPRTDLFLFESAYARDRFCTKIGHPRAIIRVVPNGVGPSEFAPVQPHDDATDLLFIGELRSVKGVDTLIEAIADLRIAGRPVSATIVGDGPDRAKLHAEADRLGIAQAIRFRDPMPAREAFALGRLMVVPSRAESLPYVVLEAAAAGLPLLATNVGGIPEIFGPLASRLVAPDSPAALARAIVTTLDHPVEAHDIALVIQDRVRAHFSLDAMVEQVLAGYRAAMAARPVAPAIG